MQSECFFRLKALCLGATVLALQATACGDPAAMSPGPATEGAGVGEVTLALELASGVSISTLTYRVTREAELVVEGGIAAGEEPVIRLAGLRAGPGYRAELAATTSHGLSCAGSAFFSVLPGSATKVVVQVLCQSPERGEVEIVPEVTLCDHISALTIAEAPGSAGVFEVAVNTTRGGPLSYFWSSPGGRFEQPSQPQTRFHCAPTAPPTVTITATVSDDRCRDSVSTTVSCPDLPPPPPPRIDVLPSQTDYGSVAVGSSGPTRVFTVVNISSMLPTGPIQLAGIRGLAGIYGAAAEDPGSDFELTTTTCASGGQPIGLAPGTSCRMSITFAPSSLGARSDTLLVFAEPGNSARVALAGQGVATLSLTPAAQNFNDGGNVNVLGATNQSFRFTVHNQGGAAVSLTATLEMSTVVGATPDGPTYFGFAPGSRPCGPSLQPGTSCDLDVRMVTPPRGTPGLKKAVLRVSGGGPATTANSELSGTMVENARVAFTDALPRYFGSVTVGTTSQSHLVQVRNTGGVPSGAMLSPVLPANFVNLQPVGVNPETGNPVCSAGLALSPGGTCDFLLAFVPTARGVTAGNLSVTVAGFGAATVTKPLSGIGEAPGGLTVTPTPISFGSAAQGAASPVERTLVVTNETGLPVNVNAAALVGPAAGFTVGRDTCAGTLSAGLTCEIVVFFQPGGAANPGPAFDSLRVTGTPQGMALLTVEAALWGIVRHPPALVIELPREGANWGEVVVGVTSGRRIFVIRNTGQDPTTTAPTVLAAAPFWIPAGDTNNTCTAALAPNATCTVNVAVTPTEAGEIVRPLTATAGAALASQNLTAVGVLPSTVEVVSIGGMVTNQPVVAFGDVPVHSELGIDVIIRNAPMAQHLAPPAFRLSDPTNFRVDTDPGTFLDCADVIAANRGLPGGASCMLRVFFGPKALPPSSTPPPNFSASLFIGDAATSLTLTLQGHAI